MRQKKCVFCMSRISATHSQKRARAPSALRRSRRLSSASAKKKKDAHLHPPVSVVTELDDDVYATRVRS